MPIIQRSSLNRCRSYSRVEDDMSLVGPRSAWRKLGVVAGPSSPIRAGVCAAPQLDTGKTGRSRGPMQAGQAGAGHGTFQLRREE